MGKIFVMEFDQPNPDYYMCRLCRTPIALGEDFEYNHSTELCGGIFTKVINVQVDKPDLHYQVGDQTVANIYCVKCGDMLGWKYIQVGGEEYAVHNGDVKIIMQKLLRRRGDGIEDA